MESRAPHLATATPTPAHTSSGWLQETPSPQPRNPATPGGTSSHPAFPGRPDRGRVGGRRRRGEGCRQRAGAGRAGGGAGGRTSVAAVLACVPRDRGRGAVRVGPGAGRGLPGALPSERQWAGELVESWVSGVGRWVSGQGGTLTED